MKKNSKIEIYLHSLRNNEFLDNYLNLLFSVNNLNYCFTVTPLKFVQLKKRLGFLFKPIYAVLILLLPLLVIISNGVRAMRIIFRKLFIIGDNNVGKVYDMRHLICLTQLTIIKTNERIKFFPDAFFLIPPLGRIDANIKNANYIMAESLIDYKGVVRNFMNVLLLSYYVCLEFKYRNLFYLLNALDWLILHDVLRDSISKNTELVFSNQKDRWAVLYDNCIQRKKTLVQHGTNIFRIKPHNSVKQFFLNVEDSESWVFDMPYKYKGINKAVSFSKRESEHLIVSEFDCVPEIVYMGFNLISLTKYKSDLIVVLIVGNSNAYSIEEAYLIENLDQNRFEILLKPHPSTTHESYSYAIGKAKIIDFLPEVDFIVGYSSTLMYEYEELGVKTLFYRDLDTTKAVLDKLNKIQ